MIGIAEVRRGLLSAVSRPFPNSPWHPAHFFSKTAFPLATRRARGSVGIGRLFVGHGSQLRQSPIAVPIFWR